MVEASANTDELKGIIDADRLTDPLGDRVVPIDKLPLPPQRLLTVERGFPEKNGAPNFDLIKEYMYAQGKLSKELVIHICNMAKKVLSKEPNLLKVEGKVCIIGDIHG